MTNNPTVLDFTPIDTEALILSSQHFGVAFTLASEDQYGVDQPYDLTGFTFTAEDQSGDPFVPTLTPTCDDPESGIITVVVDTATSPDLVSGSKVYIWAVQSGERYPIGTITFVRG